MNTFVRSDSLHTLEKPPISKVTMRVDLESDSPLANRFSLPPFAYDAPPERDEDYHHWSPISQPYAPAHVLLQYLREGWQIHERVLVEVSPCISQQCTEMYCFILIRDGVRITMPVLANPVVLRLAKERGLILIWVHICSDNNYSRRIEED